MIAIAAGALSSLPNIGMAFATHVIAIAQTHGDVGPFIRSQRAADDGAIAQLVDGFLEWNGFYELH